MSVMNKRGAGKQRLRKALWAVLSPLIGLVYVFLIPLIGLFELAFLAVKAIERLFRPARVGEVLPDGGLPVEKARKEEGGER